MKGTFTACSNALDAPARAAGWLILAVVMLWSAAYVAPARAELILSAPPRENAEAGENLYGPFADYLSGLLGEKVTYRRPFSWLEYQRDLRNDVYDIVFDGPHFVAWRVEHLKHDVLVKLPGALEFVIVAEQSNTAIRAIGDLVGKTICTFPPPNLAALIVIDQFPNPVQQPELWGVNGSYKDVYRELKAKKCGAAVFRSNFFYNALTAKDRESLRVLFQSKPLPNQAISVSQRVTSEEKVRIIESLTKEEGRRAVEKITNRFAGDQNFVTARRDEYLTLNRLLEGVIFGW